MFKNIEKQNRVSSVFLGTASHFERWTMDPEKQRLILIEQINREKIKIGKRYKFQDGYLIPYEKGMSNFWALYFDNNDRFVHRKALAYQQLTPTEVNNNVTI